LPYGLDRECRRFISQTSSNRDAVLRESQSTPASIALRMDASPSSHASVNSAGKNRLASHFGIDRSAL
jgi:hypothetical protein